MMKFILTTLLMCFALGANAADIQKCPVGGCDFSVSCQMEDANGVVKASFTAGGQNYAVAGAMYIYTERGMHQFYADLIEAAEQANEVSPGSVDMQTIPDILSPLSPIFKFE